MSEIQDGQSESGEDVAKDGWVKGFTGLDVPRRGRGYAVIGSRPEPVDPDKTAFGIALGKHYEGLRSLASFETPHGTVKKEQEKLTKLLDAVDQAHDDKAWKTGLGQIEAAVLQGAEVHRAIDTADQPRIAFSQAYGAIAARRQKALDLLPSTARLAEAKAAVVKADKILQPLIEAEQYGPALAAVNPLKLALDALDVAISKSAEEIKKTLKDTKAGLSKIATQAGVAIGKLSAGQTKKDLTAALAEFNKKLKSLDGMTDPEELIWQFSQLEPEGGKILADALKASNASATDKQNTYKEILQARFDVEVEIPPGMTNTHLDRAFEMFLQVPPDHVGHDKLKFFAYTDDPGWATSGAYSKDANYVVMGKFQADTLDQGYEIDGQKLPSNAFDVTTLHEIGHAVDAKFKIMETHGKNADHGGWSTHTVDQVAQIVFDDFTGSTALINVNPATLLGEIKDALANGDTRRLDGAFPEEADWAKIGPLLVKCAGLRENSPWQRTVKVGAKAYHRAYEDGRWVGYDPAAKTSTFVHSYQWRSPGEWFAELYAITWLAKKAPPAGVGAAAAAYLWGGASIGTR